MRAILTVAYMSLAGMTIHRTIVRKFGGGSGVLKRERCETNRD